MPFTQDNGMAKKKFVCTPLVGGPDIKVIVYVCCGRHESCNCGQLVSMFVPLATSICPESVNGAFVQLEFAAGQTIGAVVVVAAAVVVADVVPENGEYRSLVVLNSSTTCWNTIDGVHPRSQR